MRSDFIKEGEEKQEIKDTDEDNNYDGIVKVERFIYNV